MRTKQSATSSRGGLRETELLSAQAYTMLKQAIIRCELEPGTFVSEGDLMEQYGVGRAAVRTALSRLGQESLVHPHPRRGHHVSEIRLKDVRDVFDVRSQLEPLSASRAAETGANLDKIKAAEQAYRNSIIVPGDSSTIADFLAADTNFHMTVVASGGNDRMTRVLRDMFDASERLFHLALRVIVPTGDLQNGHRDIVDAIVRRDSRAAYAVTSEKVKSSEDLVIRALSFVASEQLASAARALSGRRG